MSSTVLKEGYFIGLLRTNKQQRRALLQTITKNQLRVLIEIAYNVLHGYGHIAGKGISLSFDVWSPKDYQLEKERIC